MKYRYLVVLLDGLAPAADWEELLNSVGEDGWELVQIVPGGSLRAGSVEVGATEHRAVFKKEMQL